MSTECDQGGDFPRIHLERLTFHSRTILKHSDDCPLYQIQYTKSDVWHPRLSLPAFPLTLLAATEDIR